MVAELCCTGCGNGEFYSFGGKWGVLDFDLGLIVIEVHKEIGIFSNA